MIGANKKKKVSEFATPYTVGNALTKGGATVKLSALVMGLANIAHKQIIKGLIFLAIEIAYIAYMVSAGAYYISMLPSLGWRKQEEVFNEQKQIYEYVAGDQSVLLLLYGVITIAITVLFIYMWCENLKSGYKAECLSKAGKEINSFGKDVKDLFDKNLHKTLMFLPLMGIFIFTVLPLLFMIPMAFTNYSVRVIILYCSTGQALPHSDRCLDLVVSLVRYSGEYSDGQSAGLYLQPSFVTSLDSFLLSLSIVKRHIARPSGVHALLSQLRYRSSYHSL